jgi:hypothetical protein
LIEDHTQDPFSTWSLLSEAEYAVCSLRKTLPLPDGAILWSPKNLQLPEQPREHHWLGSMLKLGAMVYKRDYLEARVPAERKARYRELQLSGEYELGAASISSMSAVSEAILARGIPKRWRERRIENACVLLQRLDGWTMAAPAFTSWPQGHAPFDLPLVFENEETRNAYQLSLQDQNIFCPVEWVCDTPDAVATDLSSRILSIPTDYRYTPEDMGRIGSALLKVKV